MTGKELQLLDEIDVIRQNINNTPLRCDDKNHTGLKEIKSLITEYFSNNEKCSATQDLKSRLFTELEEFERVPIDDYDIRVIEAIIAEYFGYKSRAEWCELLTQDKTSKYYAHCKAELPLIFK